MTSKEVLNNLRHNVYCRIRSSSIHGIGVVAIKDIPKGVNPFQRVGAELKPVSIAVSEIETLPQTVRKMVTDFCSKDGNSYSLPSSGLNGMDISFFMNHSKDPNIKSVDGGSGRSGGFIQFKSMRKIHSGEELTINYQQ